MSTNGHGLNGRARTQFKHGEPRPANGGRKKGQLNSVTVEARELAQRLVHDADYQRGLVERAQAKKLHPAIEVMIWHYAFGKPTEKLEVSGSLMADPARMTDEQLTAALATALDEMRRLTGAAGARQASTGEGF